MKLIRWGEPFQEKAGVIAYGDRRIDVSRFIRDYDEDFFSAGGLDALRIWLRENEAQCPVVPDSARLGAGIARPSKLICIGLNYSRHAKESGMEIPEEPILFMKASSSMAGPNDDVVIPKGSKKTDWEVELAVVIGKRALHVSEQDAMDYVAGYCLHNDYSERELQLERGGQWTKGKSCDTFAPLGPFLATKDEIPDPHNLRLWLKRNGEIYQDSNTSDLIFNIPVLVSYISQFMSLLPGDVFSTDTPSGVGLGFKPPRFLEAGDLIELGIDGLGVSCQRAVAYRQGM
jgi:2-keto-4-pentenoate hydratase/2-oxohepta-3-ene-1,7-dioic acid hydratase in catechol pathway